MRKTGILDGFQLKVIMAVLMLGDHLYYGLFPEKLLFAHYLSRVVAPVFIYLMCEGMAYTHNRVKYIGRMLGFGLAMLAGNLLLQAIFGRPIQNSILLSLAISAAVIACIDLATKGKQHLLWLLPALGLYFLSDLTEGGTMIPAIAIIFYYLRKKTLLMCGVYMLVYTWTYGSLYLQTGRLMAQFYMVFAVIPILLYNGKRGLNNAFSKYFFYVFYPLHIWIIYLLEEVFIYS